MFNKRVRNGNKPRIAIYSMCSLYIIDVFDDFFKVFFRVMEKCYQYHYVYTVFESFIYMCVMGG